MNMLLYGKNAASLTPLVRDIGYTVVTENPDVVISYGGDGTLLASEQAYPGIPKVALRDSAVCKKCADHDDTIVLQAIKANKIPLITTPKVQASARHQSLIGLNDIVLRNAVQIHAVRFLLSINGKLLTEEPIIGDGLVAATPFGATGYFHSITRRLFDHGFGIAFNNPTRSIAPIFLDQLAVELTIVRGPASISADNHPNFINVNEGDAVHIAVADQPAQLYDTKTLRCADCVVARQKRLG